MLSVHHGIQAQAFVRQPILDNVPDQCPVDVERDVDLKKTGMRASGLPTSPRVESYRSETHLRPPVFIRVDDCAYDRKAVIGKT